MSANEIVNFKCRHCKASRAIVGLETLHRGGSYVIAPMLCCTECKALSEPHWYSSKRSILKLGKVKTSIHRYDMVSPPSFFAPRGTLAALDYHTGLNGSRFEEPDIAID